jgi:uncharacterized membrane protein YfcA
MDIHTFLTLLAIGAFAGVASGFIGVGGGLILVPCMVAFLGVGQHAAQGTSLAMMLPPVGILAVMQYHRAGEVHWAYAAVLCITFVLGAWGGSKLSLRLSESWIRLVFGCVMLYASVRMIWKAWTALKPDLLP